ncbi:TatD family hydrolase [Buchnera aphidicola]|uniref:Uncharacterized metal-dependent hydrolase YcfH n=1 Tax=Buchnera aphidicola (Cinara strobi) TaxID=1921549 RepID=A0A3B1DWD7_9GAMM|nr:TatD family hydrolase [Buchnera aphidicola]VAX76603.1 Uncharacterized metal-dependent hydrolase YcfH [Buchnera aphidicola (Cinara strobi)]
MFLIDTHCHINNLCNSKKSISIDTILKKAYSKNVKKFLSVSTSIQDFMDLSKLTDPYENIFLSCGLHPSYSHNSSDIKNLKILSHQKKVIAIGETGLDFYKSKQKKEIQIELLKKHIYIAYQSKKPLIIHNRCSEKDIIKIFDDNKSYLLNSPGVIHSFTGNIELARKFLNFGFYISFSGIITFKKSFELREIVKYIPLDRLLIETDSPYLSPEPHRGERNQPAFLYYIAKTIQKCTKKNFSELSNILKKNFYKLFNINNNLTV